MKRPSINRLLEFQAFLATFQAVKRVTHYPVSHEAESDSEHSYNLAMTAWFLAPYFPELNRDLLIRFALVHDLVEVHAGDTYIYADKSEIDTKAQREAAALNQLAYDWQDFKQMPETIGDYESKQTKEACFIYALDKIMPIMLIFIGEGYTWQQEGIGLDRLHSIKKPKVAKSPMIEEYYDELYELLKQNEHFFASKNSGVGQ